MGWGESDVRFSKEAAVLPLKQTEATLDLMLPGNAGGVLVKDFQAKRYVEQLRSVLPRSQLEMTMQKGLLQVEQELTRTVNRNHEDVARLTQEVKNVTEGLPGVRAQAAVYGDHIAPIATESSYLERTVASVTSDLIRLEIEEELDKVAFDLLNDFHDNVIALIPLPRGRDRKSPTTAALLELCASEVKVLEVATQALTQKLEILGFKELDTAMVRRCCKTFRQTAQKTLESYFLQLLEYHVSGGCRGDRGLQPADVDHRRIRQALRGLSHLGQRKTIVKCFREIFVEAAFQQVLRDSNVPIDEMQKALVPLRTHAEALGRFLTHLISILQIPRNTSSFKDGLLILRILLMGTPSEGDETAGTAPRMQTEDVDLYETIFLESFLRPLYDVILDTFGPCCLTPIFPELFIQHYQLTLQLTEAMTAQFSGERKSTSSRVASIFSSFVNKHWNLQAFELNRCKQVTQRYESEVETEACQVLRGTEGGASSLRMTASLVKHLRELITGSHTEKGLPRVARSIADMVLNRYCARIEKMLGNESDSDDEKDLLLLESIVSDLPFVIHSLDGEKLDESAEPLHFGLRRLAHVGNSLLRMHDQELEASMVNLASLLAAELTTLMVKVRRRLIKKTRLLIEKELLAMRSVPPLYRMTARRPPRLSQPSPYVTTIAQILRRTQRIASKGPVEGKVNQELTALIASACAAFAAKIIEIRKAVEAQEKVLSRVTHQPRKSVEADEYGDKLSDTQKIHMQLLVDATTFTKDWLPPMLQESHGADRSSASLLMEQIEELRRLLGPIDLPA